MNAYDAEVGRRGARRRVRCANGSRFRHRIRQSGDDGLKFGAAPGAGDLAVQRCNLRAHRPGHRPVQDAAVACLGVIGKELGHVGVSVLIAALSGGLAGALFKAVWDWWWRPILVVRFTPDIDGCVVDTDGIPTDANKRPIANAAPIPCSYLRLHVRNRGWSFARNVSVSVTRITFRAPGAGTRESAEEVLDLKVAMIEKLTVNLAMGAHRFFDVVHAEGDNKLVVDFDLAPLRLNSQGYDAGNYVLRVFVAAENVTSVPATIRWTWNGPKNSLQITGQGR
jgi:hypothetical protein